MFSFWIIKTYKEKKEVGGFLQNLFCWLFNSGGGEINQQVSPWPWSVSVWVKKCIINAYGIMVEEEVYEGK